MDIWRFQRLLSVRLIQWALASIGIGALLSLGTKFWRGVGSQFVGWGVVNIAIALALLNSPLRPPVKLHDHELDQGE